MRRNIASRWGGLSNRRMAEKLTEGECLDLSACKRTEDDCYIIENFVEGVDYCNADTENRIWSIGRHKETGQILAAHDARFYQNPDYDCIWLR